MTENSIALTNRRRDFASAAIAARRDPQAALGR
jgi:hypothetical protein